MRIPESISRSGTEGRAYLQHLPGQWVLDQVSFKCGGGNRRHSKSSASEKKGVEQEKKEKLQDENKEKEGNYKSKVQQK
ncbi:hypothetical protein CR513_32574, partial [Mucuna pruriens]